MQHARRVLPARKMSTNVHGGNHPFCVLSNGWQQDMVSYERQPLAGTEDANGPRAIGAFFAFLALFAHHPLRKSQSGANR